MHKFKVLKLPNVSESAIPIFYKRKRYTKVLFNKMFFPKNGGKRFALAWALRAHPHFFGKNSIKKTVVYRLRFVKNGTVAFLRHLTYHNMNMCVSEHFQLAKRLKFVSCELSQLPKKRIRVHFCACVLLPKKKLHQIQRLSFTCFPADIYTGKH